METLPAGLNFPSMNLSPIRAPSKMSTTPQTASPSSNGSIPRMMDEYTSSSSRYQLDDSEADDEASISLDDLMSSPTSNEPFSAGDSRRQVDQSSTTTCFGSPNSSRGTLDTSAAIVVNPREHHHSNRNITSPLNRHIREHDDRHCKCTEPATPTLKDYLRRDRQVERSMGGSNMSIFDSGEVMLMKRSKSEKSLHVLPHMEDESFTGVRVKHAQRRRSNSFSASLSREAENDTLFDVITRLRLENDDDTTVDNSRKHETPEKLKQYSDSIGDGCNDADSYMRHARGRYISRQYSVRDATAGRSKRDKEIRRSVLRKEISAHQLKKADDFLQATDAGSLKDVVDSWKDQNNNHTELAGSLRRHLSTIQNRTDERRKRDKMVRQRSRKRGGSIEPREHSTSDTSHQHVSSSNETSETSLVSGDSGMIGGLDLSPIKEGPKKTTNTPSLSSQDKSHDASIQSKSVSSEVSETSMISDTSDMIVSPYHSELREDLNAHTSSDHYLSPNVKKRYKDKDKERYSALEAVSSFSNHEDSGVVVQFDVDHEDHISHVRLDMTSGRLLRIDCSQGAPMEGLICKMPDNEIEQDEICDEIHHSEHTDESHDQVPAMRAATQHSTPKPQMLWRGPSKFFRRQKTHHKSEVLETRQSAEQFDENGRLVS